jgi:hypothetical protein
MRHIPQVELHQQLEHNLQSSSSRQCNRVRVAWLVTRSELRTEARVVGLRLPRPAWITHSQVAEMSQGGKGGRYLPLGARFRTVCR